MLYKSCHTYCFYIGFFIVLFLGCRNNSQVPHSLSDSQTLVWIEGGSYEMGTGNEQTLKQTIPGFWMQKYEVTHLQFQEFVKATGYVTFAEKKGGSYVFSELLQEDSLSIPGAPWWKFVSGANWKKPTGQKNSTESTDNLPVVHIAYEDACAYCDWLQMRLPTEAEWEYAAKKNGEMPQKNSWQGNFPYENKLTDGYAFTAPVGTFGAGNMGLCDMNGNVWEWCSDYYHEDWYGIGKQLPTEQRIKGPYRPYDPSAPYDEMRVIRGGSYLCSENYCTGYLPTTRMRSDVKMTFGHIGFRCVKNK